MNNPRLLRDIQNQPESLNGVLERQTGPGRAGLCEAARVLRSAPRVVITGMGASMYASLSFEYQLASLGIDATVVESAELLHYRRQACRDAVVIMVSRSGESIETTKLLPFLRETSTVIGMTNDPESTLARGAHHAICAGSLPDEMVAIQSVTGMLLTLNLLGAAIAEKLDTAAREAAQAIDALPAFIREGSERLHEWDNFFASRAPVYLLGRGPSVGSAMEGALLFHETARFPAMGMPAASFRHGPVELVDQAFSGVIFAPRCPTRDLDIALAANLSRFGGRICVIGPSRSTGAAEGSSVFWYGMPDALEALPSVVEVIPIQLAALRLACLRGLTPGQFRYTAQVTLDESDFAPPG
jgi:glutamine---fructose-6-phosphate transaminase (isomerizing)